MRLNRFDVPVGDAAYKGADHVSPWSIRRVDVGLADLDRPANTR